MMLCIGSRWLIQMLYIDRIILPDGKSLARTTLPWRKISTDLAPLGIQLRNYPEGVPLPAISKRKGFQKGNAKKKTTNKGLTIQSLSMDDLCHLYQAVRNSDRPLHFALYQGDAGGKLNDRSNGSHLSQRRLLDVEDSIQPIVCGEAPPHTSKYTQGRRLFADGHKDRNGPLRRLPSSEDLVDSCHDSSGDYDSPGSDDSSSTPGAVKRRVAQLFESESDEEQTQHRAKRAKAEVDTFRPVSVQISTTPVKAKPITEPMDWSKYIATSESDSEPDAIRRPAQSVARPSKPRPAPSIADNTPAARDVKGKGRAEPVKVSDFIHSAILFRRDMLTVLTIWQASEPTAASSGADVSSKRMQLDMTQPVRESKAQLAIPEPRARSHSHSPADRWPIEPTNNSRHIHQDYRSNGGGKDRQRPRIDRNLSTRPDRDRQPSGSRDRANVPTDGSRYDGKPAGRRHDRKYFHPSQHLDHNYTGRESRLSDGPDNRGWHGPPHGRWYRPPRREYGPPGVRERAGRQYLHPDDYSYGPGESEMGEEDAGEEYADEEDASEEYVGEEYTGEE